MAEQSMYMEAWPNMYQEKILDITTGEETFRPYTKEEVAEVEANQAAEVSKLEAETQRAADKAALLERLGITAEEAALLLG
jgi:hypothetical protein